MTDATLNELLARMETLEAEIVRLKAPAGAIPDALAIHPGPSASRRDLLRYGAVALGAAAAGLTSRPAEAADGDPVLVGGSHLGTAMTTITASGSAVNNFAAIHGVSTGPTGDNFGVWGESASSGGVGLVGSANSATGQTAGVYGENNAPAGAGVVGNANADSGVSSGVVGMCASPNGFAVTGVNANGGTAIQGQLPSTSSANGIALYGLNNSSYAGPGPGAGGFGVYGLSAKGHGLVGATSSPGGAAVVGATNGVTGAYAAAFYGPVVVSGALTVVGSAKSAAVLHPDGTHRLLYCMESPESWFEDFGRGELVRGTADIAIESGFAAVADMSHYHVFLTPYDDHHLLCVTDRTPKGFRVSAADGTGCGTFSWRVVAKRKDIAGERLAPIAIPPHPTLPTADSAAPAAVAFRPRAGGKR